MKETSRLPMARPRSISTKPLLAPLTPKNKFGNHCHRMTCEALLKTDTLSMHAYVHSVSLFLIRGDLCIRELMIMVSTTTALSNVSLVTKAKISRWFCVTNHLTICVSQYSPCSSILLCIILSAAFMTMTFMATQLCHKPEGFIYSHYAVVALDHSL